MLRSLNRILSSSISAAGEIGSIYNSLVEDVFWRVAYVVTEAARWFSNHKVLFSPSVLHQPDWVRNVLPVSLTIEQVRTSPDVDTDQPISRQQELALNQFYGAPSHLEIPIEPRERILAGDIASNFASCLILLLEHPIKVGDRIEVGKLNGDVMRIGARSRWVRTNDNWIIINGSPSIDGRRNEDVVADPQGFGAVCVADQPRRLLRYLPDQCRYFRGVANGGDLR